MNKGQFLRSLIILIMFCFLLPTLSGCLYPKERLIENSPPPVQQIQQVQDAVNKYREKNGVLPIQNKDMSIPIYEKYPIDFTKLKPEFLSTIPAAAFEAGGNYLFVLINVEEKAEVRLADLTVSQKVQSLQEIVQNYYDVKHKYPFGNLVSEGYYLLDYKALGKKEEYITSPYSQQQLNFIISDKGTVGVDYAPDIKMALQKLNTPPGQTVDLRKYLATDSPLVPIKSFAYLLVNGEPHLVKPY